MKMRTALATAAFAALASGSVLAATPVDPSPSASFSNTVSGAFTDTWTFDLATPSIVAASLTNVEVTFMGTVGGIVDFAASLNGVSLLPSSSVVSPGGGVTITTKVLAGSTSLLAPGMYSLVVSGSGITGATASYGGNIVAAPVPEPETYALMLAGLGAIGFMARRRRQA